MPKEVGLTPLIGIFTSRWFTGIKTSGRTEIPYPEDTNRENYARESVE